MRKVVTARRRALPGFVLCALCGLAEAAVITLRVSDSASGRALDSVVASLVPLDRGELPQPRSASIAQANKTFLPHVSVVQTGTAVEFPNNDTVRHHVYSFSPAKVFELKLYSGKPAKPVIFDKPGVVVLGCNIHDRMSAYVVVVDTPWFGISDGEGTVRVSGVPPGDYLLQLWHPRRLGLPELPPRPLRVMGDLAESVSVDLKN
ncbi:methylamine utilization protein [Methyloversatilis thermotolerans]|uniref:methylamine utilization protein n=1 Tax=Methyloversatilis thermotolerans TaxID=1346290 RepID=UPI00035CDB9F